VPETERGTPEEQGEGTDDGREPDGEEDTESEGRRGDRRRDSSRDRDQNGPRNSDPAGVGTRSLAKSGFAEDVANSMHRLRVH
jgi:hypothetical protein